jgi:periplasmic copper chaperone A
MKAFVRVSLAVLCTATLATSAFAAKPGPAPKPDTLTIESPWARATPPGAPVAGGFLVVRNTGKADDRLVSATSPDADKVEIHEMRMDGGVMRMRRIDDGLAIAAGGTLTLAPGGYHLMFIGPKHPFAAGQTVTATLRFERGGERTVRFDVRAMGAGAAQR